MPLNIVPPPNFNVQQPPAFDPLAQQQKQATLSGMMDENALRKQLAPLQVQEQQEKAKQAAIQTQQMQIEQQSQAAMMKAWSDPDFTKKITNPDKSEASGLGFDPDAMTQELISRGVIPKDALSTTQEFVKRSQAIADTQKAVAQTGEANAGIRQKTLKQVGDALGAIQGKPVDKALEALDAFHQRLVRDPKAFPGLTQDEMAHLYSMDLTHLGAAGGMMELEAQMNEFHKGQAEKTKAEQGIIPAGGGLSPEAQQEVAKDVAVATNPQVQAGKVALTKAEAEARQQAAQGDPKTAGKMLADGSLTLADLKTRGTTPQFIEQATAEAQKIKPTYNPADEVIAEHVAKSGTANQFFGSANSLIAKGGTLDQLEKQGSKVPQHDWPVLNTIDDWQKLARGKGPLAGYAATALGVADDYGKVMGGGTASDHARDAALQLFAKAASPEQRADAIQATRDAVQSQRDSRIGNNQFLKRQYGAEVSKGAQGNAATGHVIAIGDKNYQYKGSGDTADLKNYTEVKKP